ncbi:MAG: hypothetical protein LBF32_00175 [Streptococcaceae bacterium]|jgi:hypothetical protein|nr:hypothetical protein [Streptococcaceae bacterium]
MRDLPRDNTTSQYVSYAKVLEAFPSGKVDERYTRILESAKIFIQRMGYSEHVICNEILLKKAVLGYFSDIQRLKIFHGIDRVSPIKILAYETQWLLKRKPLQIKDSSEQKCTYCNEQFAYTEIMCFFHNHEGNKGIKALEDKNLKSFTDTLFYYLKYQDIKAQSLELMLESFLGGRHYQYLLSEDIKLHSPTCADELKEFPQETVEEQYARLLGSARTFIQDMDYKEKSYSEHVICNETLLMKVVSEYFSDILRLKRSYEIDKISLVRILSYKIHWILRRKPLQIKDTNDSKYSYCNEQFAFSEIMYFFHKDEGNKGIKALGNKNLKFFTDTLFYHLKYRNVDVQTLGLMLLSFLGGRHYQHLLPEEFGN